MRAAAVILRVFFFLFLLVEAGCRSSPVAWEPSLVSRLPCLERRATGDERRFPTRYASVKINILPLTEFIDVGDAQQAKINLYPAPVAGVGVYVSVLDSFGSQIKSPGIFRFELYERVLHSTDPKGKRVVIWQDIDLTDPVKNNDHWRDFLRAYEFNLPLEQGGSQPRLSGTGRGQSYILQATCLCTSGKRLSAEFTLKRTK